MSLHANLIRQLNQFTGSGIIYINNIFSGFWYNCGMCGNNELYFYLLALNSTDRHFNLINSKNLLSLSDIEHLKILKFRDNKLEEEIRTIILSTILDLTNNGTLAYFLEQIILTSSPSLHEYLKMISSLYKETSPIEEPTTSDIGETAKLIESILEKIEKQHITIKYNDKTIKQLEDELFENTFELKKHDDKWVMKK